MFDPDAEIKAWRKKLIDAGLTDSERLAELETHLRDDLEQQSKAGANPELALQAAVQRIGEANALRLEFAKITTLKRTILSLLPRHTTQIMNTSEMSIALERRWLTYLKAGTWLLPCLSLWAISSMFLFPKLQEICRDADLHSAFMRTGIMASNVYMQYGFWILAAVVLLLVVLEWRSRSIWPRYRRAFLGFTVFILNSAVLLLLWVMLLTSLMAAASLFQANKRTAPAHATSVEK